MKGLFFISLITNLKEFTFSTVILLNVTKNLL